MTGSETWEFFAMKISTPVGSPSYVQVLAAYQWVPQKASVVENVQIWFLFPGSLYSASELRPLVT